MHWDTSFAWCINYGVLALTDSFSRFTPRIVEAARAVLHQENDRLKLTELLISFSAAGKTLTESAGVNL